ncbi:MAG: hypothetical protein BWK80_03240 [Desulfobacteraceae bacterium IS3]|nr:MAG: hypothetical protein BWK80_03240 [Desulfobacteraceae bacterium IS3]
MGTSYGKCRSEVSAFTLKFHFGASERGRGASGLHSHAERGNEKQQHPTDAAVLLQKPVFFKRFFFKDRSFLYQKNNTMTAQERYVYRENARNQH